MNDDRGERQRLHGRELPGAMERLRAARSDAPVWCASPVFVLSAAWRSGSTLVQRLLTSNGRTLVWGEPYGDRMPVNRLAQMLEPYAESDEHSAYGIDCFEGDLSEQWIANLNPGLAAMHRAHVAWFETLFAAPARERGFARWGCKWVRLTAHHARYLRWLYPQAKLVFLVRHPLDALRSYLGWGGEAWYLERPRLPVGPPSQFLRHWGELAASFLDAASDLDALLLRYEDVVGTPSALKRLAEHVGTEIDEELIGNPVGASPGSGRVPVSARVHLALRLRRVAGALGYGADGTVRELEPAP